jgi:hypothetical protein
MIFISDNKITCVRLNLQITAKQKILSLPSLLIERLLRYSWPYHPFICSSPTNMIKEDKR